MLIRSKNGTFYDENPALNSYHAVRRFVLRRVDARELPFRRMECAPGEELQVDFGLGGWVVEDGKRRRPHLFRAVLSHSRKGYSEVVWREKGVTSQQLTFKLALSYPIHWLMSYGEWGQNVGSHLNIRQCIICEAARDA